MTDDRRMLTVDEFCRRYSIGHTMAYAEMKAGQLRFCKVGRRRLIRVDDAETWSLSKRQPSPSASNPDPAANRGVE
jgi:excisionase family DNA binding protein